VTSPAPRQLLDRAARRETILRGAAAAFAEKGYAGTSMEDVAAAAGITKLIVYRHFSSKEEIFEAAVLEPVERMAKDLMGLTAGFNRADAGKRLELSEHVHEEIEGVVDQITPLLGIALFSGGAAGREFYRTRLAPLLDVTVDAIRQAMSPRQQRVMEPRTLLLTIVGMYFGLSLDALFSEQPVGAPGAARQLTHLVAFGLPEAVSGPATTPRRKGRASTGR